VSRFRGRAVPSRVRSARAGHSRERAAPHARRDRSVPRSQSGSWPRERATLASIPAARPGLSRTSAATRGSGARTRMRGRMSARTPQRGPRDHRRRTARTRSTPGSGCSDRINSTVSSDIQQGVSRSSTPAIEVATAGRRRAVEPEARARTATSPPLGAAVDTGRHTAGPPPTESSYVHVASTVAAAFGVASPAGPGSAWQRKLNNTNTSVFLTSPLTSRVV
jgi:hypothetical protein